MIQVPQQYVTAIAAALGGAQGYVVSEGFREALEALRFLDKGSGRATIAPLRLEKRDRPEKLAEDFQAGLDGALKGIRFHGVAADLVSCPIEAKELCVRYLGLSLVVESLSDALELYDRLTGQSDGHFPFQVVTLDGQLLRARGDLASGLNGERDASLVAREMEIVLLSEMAERAKAHLAEAKVGVAALQSEQAELARALSECAAGISRLQANIATETAAYTELASQVAKGEAAIEWHRSRMAAADREALQTEESRTRTKEELAAADAKESEARAQLEKLRGDVE